MSYHLAQHYSRFYSIKLEGGTLMLHLWPTMADMFGTLPLLEQAELICLADAYGIPVEPGDDEEGGTS